MVAHCRKDATMRTARTIAPFAAIIAACTTNLATDSPVDTRQTPDVLLLGDSLTTGYGRTFAAAHPGVVRIAARDGQGTRWMQSAFQRVLAEEPLDAIVILGGVNDIAAGRSPDDIAHSLITVASDAERRGMRVLILTLLPWRGYPTWTPEKQERTNELNRLLASRHGAVDVGALLGDGSGYLKPEYRGSTLPDGYLHPNVNGNRKIASAVLEALQRSVSDDNR